MEEIRNTGNSKKPIPNWSSHTKPFWWFTTVSLQLGHKASKISIIFASLQQIFPLCSACTNRKCYITVKKNYFLLKTWWCPCMSMPLLGRDRIVWSVQNYMFYTVSPVQWLRYGMDNLWTVGKFLTTERNSSLQHSVQNSPGAHPAPQSTDIWASFPRGNTDGAWSWPFTSI
jgi:hypothetical protein